MNPYESPRSADAPVTIVPDGTFVGEYGLLAGVAVSLSALFAMAVLSTRSLASIIFDDADLPALTAIAVSPWFALAACFVCAAIIAKQRLIRSRVVRAVSNRIAITLVLALAAVYSVALALPSLQTGDNLL
jgi:hypothetical protein